MSKQKFKVQSMVEQKKGPAYKWITVQKINDFRDKALEGTLYRGHRKAELLLLKKHPFIAETDKGCFQWVDMYMWNVRKTDATPMSYEYYYMEG